jgi:hypothetical protein
MRAIEYAFFAVLFSAVACRAATVAPISDEFAVLEAVSRDYCSSKDFHYGRLLATAARIGHDPNDDARLQSDLAARLGESTNHHLVERLFTADGPPASLPMDVDYACLYLMDPKQINFVGRSKQKYESRKAITGSWGEFQISLPAFSTDHESALVYFTYTFGGLAGRSQVIVLKRSAKGWSVIDRLLLAVE